MWRPVEFVTRPKLFLTRSGKIATSAAKIGTVIPADDASDNTFVSAFGIVQPAGQCTV
jgi:hypothetical protein